MKSEIKINNDLLVFKSNKIVSKGISKLLIYNYKRKKDIPTFLDTDEEYSFVFSPLGQALINHKIHDKEEKEDIGNKILLFACKKYIKSQKNGILLLYNMCHIPEDKDKKLEAIKVNSYFHNTGIFEPFCICPLLIIDSKNILENSVETKETDYFLVGGFEKRRKQGMIKLYKIIYDEKNKKVPSIEYIEDFNSFDNKFKGFNGPISCITQSKKDGNLLITCWDGKVYLIDKPYIKSYLEHDEQIKKLAKDLFLPLKDKNQNEFNKNEEFMDEKTNSNFIQ
jgi:hypothetical protein